MAVYTSPFFGLIFHDYAARLRHSAQSFLRFVEDLAFLSSLMHPAPGDLITLGHVYAWQKRKDTLGRLHGIAVFYFGGNGTSFIPPWPRGLMLGGLEHPKDSIPLNRS